MALRLKRLRSPLTVTRGRFISSELTMTSVGLVPFCVMVSVVVMEGSLVDDKVTVSLRSSELVFGSTAKE